MRRRRVPLPNANGQNNGNGAIGNGQRDLNNALNGVNAGNVVEQGAANEVEENRDEIENDGNQNEQNPGFLMWLIGALNVNILLRMGMFMWFIGSSMFSLSLSL